MPMTHAELQAHVVTRAFEDHNFRARLLADPKAAIHDLTGASIPDAIHVHVHQETATTFHLVLPPPLNPLPPQLSPFPLVPLLSLQA